jgi:cytochrome c oxidase subunit 1
VGLSAASPPAIPAGDLAQWQTPETPPAGNWGPELPVVYRWAYEYGAPGNKDDFVPQNQPPDGHTAVALGHRRNV